MAYYLSENAYARVTGNINWFHSQKYINASRIKPVSDPHEIFHHLLDVIAVQASFDDRGSTFPPQTMGQLLPTDIPALAGRILRQMQKEPDRPDGVDIMDIARGLDDDALSIQYAVSPSYTALPFSAVQLGWLSRNS
jgi:hypothetical protein